MTQRVCFFLLLILRISVSAQDMQQGFTYLETGKYTEATTFFEQILKEYPTHKTARLCYGRAIGLSGNTKKAITIFRVLRQEYPTDFEVQLNYAESLLWDHQLDAAESFYSQLITEQPTNFSALLGYANTLSNLKKYEEAMTAIANALAIQKGNPNALVSRKYIRLGYASQLSRDRAYEEAIQLLDQNLIDFPNDQETQLNKASIFLITKELDKATQVYTEIAVSPSDSIIALNGLSLVAHKQQHQKKALVLAKKAIKKVVAHKKDTVLYLATKERYIQALLWNHKFLDAYTEIQELRLKYPDTPVIQSIEAAYGMYTSNFDISIQNYTQLLVADTTSFDGNLGIANAYRAIGKEWKAYEYAFKTLSYYPKQLDAEVLIHTLQLSHTPFITQKTAFTFDNANNRATTLSLLSAIPLSTRVRTNIRYAYRHTENTVTKNQAYSDEVTLQFSYKFNGYVGVETSGGISKSIAITTDYTQWTGEVKLITKPYRLQYLDIGYRRVLQDFNADLIDREIVMNDYFLTYTMGTNIHLGWYTQYLFTNQSDSNSRHLLFSSVYYRFLQRPIMKTGINYQYISFKDQLPTVYFSPKQFHVTEAFIELTSNQDSKWFYGASAAAGYQFIEDDPGSTTFRTEGKVGYRVSDRFLATAYGKYSTIASATATGFRFTEFGLLLKWYFLRKPIFNKQLIKLKKEIEE